MHGIHAEPLTHPQVTRDLLGRLAHAGGGYWSAVTLFGLLALAGLVSLILLVGGGPQPSSKWGYTAAALAFLLSTFQTAPVVAFATRLAKGYWALPIRRAAEVGAVAGFVTAPLYIVLLFQLPDWRGRPNVWFNWPGAPVLWDTVAMVLLTLTGLALLYFSARPDLAASSKPWARRLSFGWVGTPRQWEVLTAGLVVLGAFYLMVLVFVHVFTVSDLAMSLVPGWKSAVIPPYHGVSALQAGVATTILLAGALRKFGGFGQYIGLDCFWGAAKLMLGLSLLFFYFTWSELLTNWYGRLPEEQFLLDLLMFGPYLTLFVLSFSLNFVLPFALLIWNPIRVSIRGPIAVAALIFIGNFIDRLRIYVASWSVAGPVGQHLQHAPPAQYPGPHDILIVVGALAAIAFAYLVTLKVVPALSVWEYKTSLVLTDEQRYLGTWVRVIAKPR